MIFRAPAAMIRGMAMPLRDCRVCGKILLLNPEKKTGVCDACRRAPPRHACMKCGRPLILTPEKTHGLCRQCGILQVRCVKCNKDLTSAAEKSAALCNACKSEAERLPKARIRT